MGIGMSEILIILWPFLIVTLIWLIIRTQIKNSSQNKTALENRLNVIEKTLNEINKKLS